MGVEFDNYYRTHSEENRDLTRHFLLKMRENGHVELGEVESYYCEVDRKHLPDRFILGTCPYCQADDQYSDGCEACQRALEPGEILEPKCSICGTPPVTRKTKHFFLKLSDMSDDLEAWLKGQPQEDFPVEVVNHVLGWIEGGLRDWDFTREDYWGFKLPYPDAGDDQHVYVWVDAPIGYFASFIKWARDHDPGKESWLKDPDTRLVHFIGKDIIQHHLIFWPAMLMAVKEFVLPRKYVVNGYISLEGKKMSKSRGWYIPVQRATSRYPSDYLRFYLSYKASNTTADSNYSWREFQERINRELADNIGNFIHRVLTFTYNNFDGAVPEAGELSEADTRFRDYTREMMVSIGREYEACNNSKVVQGLVGAFMVANRYFNDQKPWTCIKVDRAAAGTTMNLCLNFVKSAAALMYPVVPGIAERVWGHLGEGSELEGSMPLADGPPLEVPPGREMPKPVVLVEKIEDEKIQEEIDWLERELGKEEETVEEEVVSIEEFKKIEIRVAEVLEAEEVKGSRNLIKLKVDAGGERTLVAGLQGHYEPKDLVGKRIAILANLKPAKIFGIESKGMLLAAVDGDEVSVLVSDKEVSPGTRVE
jgi:methionyl-tRNA synthetase